MSWSNISNPYAAFTQDATNYPAVEHEPQWHLEIWEPDNVTNVMFCHQETSLRYSNPTALLRVLFAPPDLPQFHSLPQLLRLFDSLSVPREFAVERTLSVAHSFGQRVDSRGTSTWFHFLCKRIEPLTEVWNVDQNLLVAAKNVDSVRGQAKYGWYRSGFFLRTTDDGRTTLVCFGATLNVSTRIVEFLRTNELHIVQTEPLVLVDLVLEGLCLEVNTACSNMGKVFRPMEHEVLNLANSKDAVHVSKSIDFAGLHDCAKHIVYVAEAIDSMLLVVDKVRMLVNRDHEATNTARQLLVRQLISSLEYRQTLFQSIKLQQNSLQKRIDVAITLAFNIVTQENSMVAAQDSRLMKIIAAVTLIFLPTTTVAAILGGQLFLSQLNEEDGSWTVKVTPPFNWLWWISIPMTLFVALFTCYGPLCRRNRGAVLGVRRLQW